ncbi:pseudaminic acid cytidylyltransferase [Cognatazoarcus halotolerans]|uniref:pseudaminic acid cytidylyltransferase n=1 Tax=Cognatazoarcus halotolerans TaxID=2686016 RepID=UPI0013588D80|nr:pseudaminic acid cytidylyltransferase [Cognatazoarcus halotolerans]MCB1899978.1 pseudaminic acid cytidylyltransferase [Rhodocyclaceae bacterium]MCP5311091.1 pseudaminic acid cytidylyltransferase [Zoogloeaceae bacterium]
MKLAVIPARGGSKRIPRKNIRDFAGRPIIAHSIGAALESGCFDRVIVSTDDEEIAAVARQWGAETPFLRPATLADEHTGTNAVVKHAIGWFREAGHAVELACCIYATAPFVQARYLRQGLERLAASDKAFAFSVTSFPFPIQRAIRINAAGAVEAIWPENIARRSQDLEEAFHDAGQFYWGRADAFLADTVLFSPVSLPVVLPRHLVQDIDTLEDWQRAEHMYRALELAGEIGA